MRIGRLFISARWDERLDEEQRICESITSNVRAMLRDRNTELYQAVVRVTRGMVKDVIEEQRENPAPATEFVREDRQPWRTVRGVDPLGPRSEGRVAE